YVVDPPHPAHPIYRAADREDKQSLARVVKRRVSLTDGKACFRQVDHHAGPAPFALVGKPCQASRERGHSLVRSSEPEQALTLKRGKRAAVEVIHPGFAFLRRVEEILCLVKQLHGLAITAGQGERV